MNQLETDPEYRKAMRQLKRLQKKRNQPNIKDVLGSIGFIVVE